MLFEKINEIRNTQGTNAKLEKLKEFSLDEDFKKVLFYTYNPFYLYYVIKIPKIEYSHNPNANIKDMFSLLDDLRTRKYTGNMAIDKISNLIHNSIKENGELFKLILGRDLKMGINTTSINKIIPGLIPDFTVMLADSGVDLKKVVDKDKWVYVQKKSDGKRCICICEKENDITNINFYARSGKEINNLYKHKGLIGSITAIREAYLGEDFVLDGEIIIENEDGSDVNRQYSNGLIGKKDLEIKEVERFTYVVWDIISLDSFKLDNNHITYEERYYTLLNVIKPFKNLKIIPTFVSTNEEDIMKITNKFIEQGFEGSIVKTPYHYYQRKRSKNWIKLKCILECDLKVVNYNYGNIGTKYENMMGALICESEDGLVKVDVGTGYSDEQRGTFTKEGLVGTIITVQYNQIIQNLSGEYSLYLPRFVEKREKTEADTLSKIINESKYMKK